MKRTAGLSVCLLIPQGLLLAQEPVEPETVDEIIVTAQRVEQALTEVPSSITVVSSEAIADYQIQGLGDYTALSPNVGFFSAGDPLSQDLSFRGISNLGGAVNSVAVYVDDLNITPGNVTRTNDALLFDVERIEILRGPQGTSFGRNVLGGGISITTKKPDQEFGGTLEVDYGRFDTVLARGSVNIPITDTFALLASGYYEESAGFIKSTGPADARNDRDGFGGRLALRFTPSDTVTLDLSLSHSDERQGLPTAVPTGILDEFYATFFGPFVLDPQGDYAQLGFYPDNKRSIAVDRPIEFDNETSIVTARLEIDAESVAWVFNAGYITNEATSRGDSDYTSGSHFFDENLAELDSYSVEARVQSSAGAGNGGLTWVAGVLFAKDEDQGVTLRVLDTDFFDLLGVPVDFLPRSPPLPITNQTRGIDIESLGVFGDAAWTTVDERFTFGAGLRFSRDKVTESFEGREVFDFSTFSFITNGTVEGGATFESWTPKVSVLFRATDRINLYTTVARGTKPGGLNLGVLDEPGLPATYESESAINYEFGVKGSTTNNLTLSAAAFYTDWTDLQLETLFVASGLDATILTINAGKASALGVEFDFAWRPVGALTLQGGAGWLDAEIGNNVFDVDPFGAPDDISGNRLPITSEFSANLAAQWDFNLSGDVAAFVRGEYSYRGDQFGSQRNISEFDDLSPSYDVFNLRLGIEREGLRIVAYGENLADSYQRIGFRAGSGFSGFSGQLATLLPTTYGVRITKEF
jgi:iron complex outermembrane recepter protein